jgi:thioesterase domain-containing protein
VYAPQTTDLSEAGPRDADIGGVAAAYLQRIRTMRPHGPYWLLG